MAFRARFRPRFRARSKRRVEWINGGNIVAGNIGVASIQLVTLLTAAQIRDRLDGEGTIQTIRGLLGVELTNGANAFARGFVSAGIIMVQGTDAGNVANTDLDPAFPNVATSFSAELSWMWLRSWMCVVPPLSNLLVPSQAGVGYAAASGGHTPTLDTRHDIIHVKSKRRVRQDMLPVLYVSITQGDATFLANVSAKFYLQTRVLAKK